MKVRQIIKTTLREGVDPSEVEQLVGRLKSGEINYEEFRRELDGLEYGEYSTRQGEMGHPDRREQQAWDRERGDWEEADAWERDHENDDDKLDLGDFDNEDYL